jgi:Zinc knuckle
MMAPEASGTGRKNDTPDRSPQQSPSGADARNSGRKQRHQQNRNTPAKIKFEGRCADLKDFVFDCAHDTQSDLFARTQREIGDYAGRTYKYGGAIRKAVLDLEEQAFDLPDDPPDNATLSQQRLWEKAVDEVAKMQGHYNQNLMSLFALVLGQCSDALREKLRSKTEYAQVNTTQNGLQLLNVIRGVAFNYESNKFVAQAVAENIGKVWKCIQEPNESNANFADRFKTTVEVVEQSGGEIGHQPGIEQERELDYDNLASIDADDLAALRDDAKELFLTTIFLLNADRRRYKELQVVTQNDYTRGHNNFPRNRVKALEMLDGYLSLHRGPNLPRGNDGVTFHNSGTADDGSSTVNANAGGGNTTNGGKASVKCRKCKGIGHYARECPSGDNAPGGDDTATNETVATNPTGDGKAAEGKGRNSVALSTVEMPQQGLTLHEGDPMPRTWVLLDLRLPCVFAGGKDAADAGYY